MRGNVPFTCTMVSICVNHFPVKFVQNLHEICTKFTCTANAHVCWHMAVNMNYVQILREFNEHFSTLLVELSCHGTMIPGGCDEQYSCSGDIQMFVSVTLLHSALFSMSTMPCSIACKALGPFHIVRS